MSGLEAANRLTVMLTVWYLNRLCDLLERLEDSGALPTDPATVWLVRGARRFAREWTQPPELRDLQAVLAACDEQIAIEYDCCDGPFRDRGIHDGACKGEPEN